MLKAILLFGMLISTVQGKDLCCSDIQKSLEGLKSDVADLKGLVKDLRERLGEEYKWTPTALCLPGFTYLPSVGSCYKAVYERHDWYSAGKTCQALGRGSHLVAVTSASENQALKTFLASELSKNVNKSACILVDTPHYGELFWTSGQRALENNCESKFEWKPSNSEKLPFVFTSWMAGEPNCLFSGESCVQFWPQRNFDWNDLECNKKICPLCEYKP